VTDTGAIHGPTDVPIDQAGPSHIYAFDIVYPKRTTPASEDHTSSPSPSSEPILTNRRTFAYAPGKFPDGIKCDLTGNVYAGCGNGIEIWNASGVLLGAIKVEGGIANFCFGEKGTLYACNETRFWRFGLYGERVRGALLGI
jgi:gluconolactonase